jgi:hypothetical protein
VLLSELAIFLEAKMYPVDVKDRVVPLDNVPQSSAGAPLPFVVADEDRVVLAYYLETPDDGWDGSTVRVVDSATSEEPVALVRFNHCTAHMFGPPNDEAFAGHPLAKRGLQPYGAYRIESSSWIRQLEHMNSVHPQHRPDRYWELQHFIFAFHDSTFDCVCRDFEVWMRNGPIAAMVPEMVELLQWRAMEI